MTRGAATKQSRTNRYAALSFHSFSLELLSSCSCRVRAALEQLPVSAYPYTLPAMLSKLKALCSTNPGMDCLPSIPASPRSDRH
jgi:hypothetical protein